MKPIRATTSLALCAPLLVMALYSGDAAADTIHYRYGQSSVDAQCATDPEVTQACDRNCSETREREMRECVDLYLAERPQFDLWDFFAILACVKNPRTCVVTGGEQLYNWLVANPEAWDRAKHCSAEADRRAGQCILAQTNCISTICGLDLGPPPNTDPYDQDPNPGGDGGGGTGGYVVCEFVTVTNSQGDIVSQGTNCH